MRLGGVLRVVVWLRGLVLCLALPAGGSFCAVVRISWFAVSVP